MRPDSAFTATDSEDGPVEKNPTRTCELIVGLGKVEIRGVDDEATGPPALHPDAAPTGLWGLRRGGVIQGLGADEAGEPADRRRLVRLI